jgi:hypothetical protein
MLKMKAYTLVEVIVTMLLSAIIIGIAITGYSMTNDQFRIFDTSTKQSLDVLQFDAMMKTDVDKCNAIFWEDNELILKGENNIIIYSFDDEIILRKEQLQFEFEGEIKVKTIELRILKKATFFENEQKDYGIIDTFILSINNFGRTQILPYSKRYSAVQLMNFKEK